MGNCQLASKPYDPTRKNLYVLSSDLSRLHISFRANDRERRLFTQLQELVSVIDRSVGGGGGSCRI